VVPNHVCPVVNSFEELVVTDTEGSTLQRLPVTALGLLS
jgi:D-serine deaminase-like pyridoxal phosphate-dependent protein